MEKEEALRELIREKFKDLSEEELKKILKMIEVVMEKKAAKK